MNKCIQNMRLKLLEQVHLSCLPFRKMLSCGKEVVAMMVLLTYYVILLEHLSRAQTTTDRTRKENYMEESLLSELMEIREELDALKLLFAPPSCKEIAKQGLVQTKTRYIDPDGFGIRNVPIKVECLLPEGITRINVDSKFSIHRGRHDNNYHDFSVVYDANLEQIVALINISSECSQTISFDCFVSPLKLKSQSLLFWLGGDGKFHPLTELDSDSCNNMSPTWITNSGTVTEKRLLPIQGIRYGPTLHEHGKATIKVGPLTCKPLEKYKKETSEFEERLAKLETRFPACPQTDPNFQVIDGKCYYFSAEKKIYGEAQRTCLQKFGGDRKGKLFEPWSTTINDKVYNASVVTFGPRSYWIGIKKFATAFRYANNQLPLAFEAWDDDQPNGQTCGIIGWRDNSKWHDWICNKEEHFICESETFE